MKKRLSFQIGDLQNNFHSDTAGPQVYNEITYPGGATQVKIFDKSTLIPIGKHKTIK